MTSTPRVWTQKWESIQNQLISPCLATDLESFISVAGGLPPVGETHRFTALWDTGATHSVIGRNVVNTLHLKQEGFIPIVHANGEDIAPIISPFYYQMTLAGL